MKLVLGLYDTKIEKLGEARSWEAPPFVSAKLNSYIPPKIRFWERDSIF